MATDYHDPILGHLVVVNKEAGLDLTLHGVCVWGFWNLTWWQRNLEWTARHPNGFRWTRRFWGQR